MWRAAFYLLHPLLQVKLFDSFFAFRNIVQIASKEWKAVDILFISWMKNRNFYVRNFTLIYFENILFDKKVPINKDSPSFKILFENWKWSSFTADGHLSFIYFFAFDGNKLQFSFFQYSCNFKARKALSIRPIKPLFDASLSKNAISYNMTTNLFQQHLINKFSIESCKILLLGCLL